MDHTDRAAKDFDQEKWHTEVDLRRREVELKEREQPEKTARLRAAGRASR
jgi:hypothetical protein